MDIPTMTSESVRAVPVSEYSAGAAGSGGQIFRQALAC
jgi:hypothetical protein